MRESKPDRRLNDCRRRATWGTEEAPEEGQKAPVMRRAFITAEPHPLLNGAALIVVGTSAGYVTAWELTDTK